MSVAALASLISLGAGVGTLDSTSRGGPTARDPDTLSLTSVPTNGSPSTSPKDDSYTAWSTQPRQFRRRPKVTSSDRTDGLRTSTSLPSLSQSPPRTRDVSTRADWLAKFGGVGSGSSRASIAAPEITESIVPVNNLMDATAVEAAGLRAANAAKLERRGNRAEATEEYLRAVDMLLKAFPVAADVDRKVALEQVLSDFMRRTNMSQHISVEISSPQEKPHPNTLADSFIDLAVKTAISIKQSPLPDMVGSVARYTYRKAQQVDQLLGVQEKAWQVGRVAVNKGIEFDREYGLHQKFADVVFVGAAALLKAGIAYREAKPYGELMAAFEEYQQVVTGSERATERLSNAEVAVKSPRTSVVP